MQISHLLLYDGLRLWPEPASFLLSTTHQYVSGSVLNHIYVVKG